MKNLILSCAACVLTCLASAATTPRPANGNPPPPPSGSQPQPGSRQPAAQGQRPSSTTRPAAGGRQPQRGTAAGRARGGRQRMERRLAPADQRLLEAIENADTLAQLTRLMRQAQLSAAVEVRQAMVDALEDKDRGAANNLAVFIVDPDEDVAESAFSAWSSALEDMRPARRAFAIQEAAKILQLRLGMAAQPAAGGQIRR